MGVSHSGLGFRQSSATSLASCVDSRYSSRAHVEEMLTHVAEAGLGSVEAMMVVYDQRTLAAALRLISILPSEIGRSMKDKLDEMWDVAEQAWAALFDENADMEPNPSPQRRRLGEGILPSDGDDDPEFLAEATGSRALKIQRAIMKEVDEYSRSELRAQYQRVADEASLRRLDELSHPDVDQSWKWSLSRHHGASLTNAQFIEAIRLRLGCAGPSEPIPCALCGGIFDSSGAHAHCCDIAEATRGHNAVTSEILSVFQRRDPSAEKEVAGLILQTALTPADILTSCIDTGLTALDIGITCPDAQYAGSDCTQGMYERKLEKYAPHQTALERQNIAYQLLIFSCYGRPHVRTTAILRTLSKRVARRRGCSDARAVFARLMKAGTVEIWRRGAKQCQCCWPELKDCG